MTAPVFDVVLRLPDGGTLVLCHDQTPYAADGSSWIRWEAADHALETIATVLRAIPGAEASSPRQALAEADEIARSDKRGLERDDDGRWDRRERVAERRKLRAKGQTEAGRFSSRPPEAA